MTDAPAPIKLLVSDREAAGMLSMGRSTFWRAVSEGVLPQPVNIKLQATSRWPFCF